MYRHYIIIDTPAGLLRIVAGQAGITNIDFMACKPEAPADAAEKETPVLQTAAKQLAEYFAGKRTRFEVRLDLHGTDFRKRVWNALCAIPYGRTCSYKEIAVYAGCPKGARAAGLANNCNPVPIIVPCHRVIGSDGSLTGYAAGLHVKRLLLDLERSS